MNTLTALALRRITSEGSSVGHSSNNSSTSPTSVFTNSSFQHKPSVEYDRLSQWVGAFDGSTSRFYSTPQCTGSGPLFNMAAPMNALPQPSAIKPHFLLLTDVGRRYPGFPTPLSPTLNTKELYSSPTYDPRSVSTTPLAPNTAERTATPMSIDGSEMCGPSRRCESHGYNHFASQLGLIDNIISKMQLHNTSRSPSASSRSIIGLASPPTTPLSHMSPRTAMRSKLAVKYGLQELSLKSIPDPGPELEFHPNARNLNATPASPPSSIPSFSSTSQHLPPPPSIHIANGVESEAASPIDPSGTMLFYTSNRSVDSGLLGVPPLSEPQVAEYRFWRPCGRRVCGFGCGTTDVGETAAAKRLFRDAEEVVPKDDEQYSDGSVGGYGYGIDGQVEQSSSEESVEHITSTWAGRRLVTDWNLFLSGCEREGVAAF